MKWIVYLTTCIVNKKIYIGYHKTEDPKVFDGYIGCGVYIDTPSSYKKRETPFQCAVEKYGVNKFIRVTLGVYDTLEEAAALEATIVTKEFIQRQDTYNIKLGGEGGCPEESKVKIYMYDLDGNFVKDFDTAFDCCKYFNPKAKNGSSVLKAIRTGQTLHDYQFSKENLPYMKKFEAKKGSHSFKRKIGRYDENGNLLEVWESTLACKNAGYQNVAKALKYSNRKCKGFFFKYIND